MNSGKGLHNDGLLSGFTIVELRSRRNRQDLGVRFVESSNGTYCVGNSWQGDQDLIDDDTDIC